MTTQRDRHWPRRLLWCALIALAASALAGAGQPAYRVAAAGPSAPAHTPTSAPTATATDTPPPTDTATAIPSQTPYPTYTPFPSPTTAPVGAISGTAPLTSTTPGRPSGGGPGWGLGPFGVIHWFDFLGSIGSGLLNWLFSGITDLINAFASMMASVVRVDQWPGIAGFFIFMLKVGAAVALGLTTVATVVYYRGILANKTTDAALGLYMLHRTLETAVLLAGLGWIISQLFELAQRLVDATLADTSTMAVRALLTLVAVFVGGDIIDPITDVLGVVSFVIYLLIILVKLGSVAALCWLTCAAPLTMATWPLGPGIAGRWFSALASVLLWGVGWAVWLVASLTVLFDWTVNPLLTPVLVVMLLLFGYGVPRLVDHLLGTAMARLSGAAMIPNAVIGAVAGGISGAISGRISTAVRGLLP